MYGIVSASVMGDTLHREGAPELWDRQRTLFGRVANVDTLKWIKTFISKYEN